MGNLFAELKRRHIYRVAAAYAVVAWVLLQLVNNVAPVLDLPVWVARAFLLALVVGFPVAMFFAWMRELAPADGPTARAVTSKLDWVLIGGLVIVLTGLSYQQLAPTSEVQTAQPQASAAPAAKPGGISIAVLPFVNLSSDKEQEFFSDGMTEEITSALAKVSGLNVVARTSAFQFKGENKDMRAIGQALGASHLIEGSVRKDGNQLRITAQLIKADDGTHLWTESYDRELKGVFAVQEEISEAIASALRVPLGLQQGERIVSNRTENFESYDQYLRARTLFRARAAVDAIKVLEPVVAGDPGFAPGWALLAQAYLLVPTYDATAGANGSLAKISQISLQSLEKAEKAAREATRLDPKNAMGYSAMADAAFDRGRWEESENFFRQALEFDPNEPDTLERFSIRLAQAGRFKDALGLTQKLRALEPSVPAYNIFGAWTMALNGQSRAGISLLEQMPSNTAGGFWRNYTLANLYADQARYGEAADTLLAIPPQQNLASRRMVEDAARLLRSAPQKVKSPGGVADLEMMSWVYAYVGAPDRMFDWYDRMVDAHWFSNLTVPWFSSMAPLRKTDRFKALMRNAGLVDYWRARGWPDLCRPVGADDFECD